MSYIQAIQHASIGYFIKRRSWQQYLCLNYAGSPPDQLVYSDVESVGCSQGLPYLPGTPINLELEDYQARDWEKA